MMKCCICKKDIHALPEPEGELNPDYVPSPNTDEYVNETNWNDGVADFVIPGYGSSHDMSKFRIAICDECLTRESQTGVIVNLGECFPSQAGIDAWGKRMERINQLKQMVANARDAEGTHWALKAAMEYIEQRG